MKKLLIGLAMIGALCAGAQDWQKASFMAVQSIFPTNGVSFTNLLSPISNGTNIAGTKMTYNGITFTNNAGGPTTNRGTLVNVFKDVPLWARPDGSPVWHYYPITNITALTTANLVPSDWVSFTRSDVSLVLNMVSTATTAITLSLSPIYDGGTLESAQAKDIWTFTFTPVAGTTTMSTNVPLAAWPGARALRLRSVTQASFVYPTEITDIALVGYRGTR